VLVNHVKKVENLDIPDHVYLHLIQVLAADLHNVVLTFMVFNLIIYFLYF
jgi:hypothetical protein